ncbi:twin-arginine translocase subunit TatB [Rhizobium sp. WL3]|uniref:Sec-independent protein translocase protein TatB n=1 Tax=Rhizobium sp. WL3 TaxID=2603277 RepID=UPI0011C1E00E|nr:Sec-independent protein translocase protein TatB [Rhizobium sp. WL3]QEE47635.1 twin-arginine translocase subunit TatB [Rhizobium sp. WL3]
MLDIGWTELLVVAVILIVVVGPKDLPPMIRAFGKMTKRLRQTAGEFRSQFDEALREAELDDLKSTVNDIRSLNPTNSIRETLNPLRQMGQEIKSDLERSTRPQSKPAPQDDGYEENSILPVVPLGLGEVPDALKPPVVSAAQPAAPAAAAPVTSPATSAPAAPAPVAVKKAPSRKPAAKAVAPAKAAPKSAKAAPVAAVAPITAKPAATKPRTAAGKSTATKLAPADTASAKPAPKARKPKSEDRA